MPAGDVPVPNLVSGPRVQHGVLPLQTAHEAGPAAPVGAASGGGMGAGMVPERGTPDVRWQSNSSQAGCAATQLQRSTRTALVSHSGPLPKSSCARPAGPLSKKEGGKVRRKWLEANSRSNFSRTVADSVARSHWSNFGLGW
jgi:hypothetical protein